MDPIPNTRDELDAWWMPFTANRQFKAAPRLLKSAEGMYYRSDDDRRVLDGTAGLWCVNAGHGRAAIARAVAEQLTTLDYAPAFQMGHRGAFELADRLGRMAPGLGDAKLHHVFFTGSGSESVDTALKMAVAYQRAIGQGTRTRFIGRERGYHGVGFGGVSVGGIVGNRRVFPMLPGVDHIRHTLDLDRNRFSRGSPAHGVELADDLERLVALHGAETIAAVIVEPVAGSTGVLPPPVGYLARLREIADRHGVLLIFDEVITGFGRLGAPFAADAYGVTPDLMTTAKALTNGVVPMGAVFCGDRVHDALMQGPPNAVEFAHGYTYSGHPVACAAASAVLDIYEEEDLFARAGRLAPRWAAAIHAMEDLPHVVDIRTAGLIAGIELAPRPKELGRRAYDAFVNAFEQGLLIRVTGETIALSPPLIISDAEIDQLVETLSGVIGALT